MSDAWAKDNTVIGPYLSNWIAPSLISTSNWSDWMAGSWTRVRLTIVLDDADLELAASAGAWGSFLHQGADSSRG
jgi:hypothetical protein